MSSLNRLDSFNLNTTNSNLPSASTAEHFESKQHISRSSSSVSIKSAASYSNSHKKFRINNDIIRFLRVLFSTLYLIYIILTIPLSFEVGGLNCGLSYSLTILILYFCLATLRVLKYHRFISSFLYYLQHLLLPTLLSYFLSIFEPESRVGSTVKGETLFEKIWWFYIIKFWKFFLINSTPLFTILEGFCSLLSVQAIGQMLKYLIKNRSADTWSILNLILSACVLSTSIYFAGKIYVSPLIDLEHVGLISASLLGCVFTLTILITFYAIYFDRATTLESSLMVAYIVKCCYELFPELSKNNISGLFKFVFNEFKKIDNQAKRSLNLNKEHIISSDFFNYLKSCSILEYFSLDWLKQGQVANYIAIKFPKLVSFNEKALGSFKIFNDIIIRFFMEHFPGSFEPLWDFLKISISNLTFSILIQLAYRIAVFFAATKIIPILTPINHGKAATELKTRSTSSRLIYLYSPCIIIAVYTNLMIQYNYEIEKETHFFMWINNKFAEIFGSEPSTLASTLTQSATSNTLSSPSIVSNLSSSISSSFSLSIHAWQFWNWVNIFLVLILYFSELVSFDPEDSTLTDHWN
ncbi:hypothetical protein CANINC_003453 [Pichia inconspicua]|uniref:Uncharacterized protein n=1 Tax=Pichia inconspicua TaxID=52247 RepID=A0A4V4NFF6_9ASCO|nr:hypothetical protein CANINC_003453 [[Candida] inconspicua]